MSSYKTDAGTLKVVIVDANGNTIGVGTMSGNPTQTEAGTLKVVLADTHGNELATDSSGFPLITTNQVALNGQGLISQNFDRQISQGTQVMIDGTAYMMLVPLIAGQVVTNISIIVGSAGSSVTLSKVGLYDTSGNRLAVSADQGTGWESTGLKTIALASAYTVPTTGVYYVAVIAKASSTLPSLYRGVTTSNQIGAAKVGTGAAVLGTVVSQTDLAASVTIGSTVTVCWWVGLS